MKTNLVELKRNYLLKKKLFNKEKYNLFNISIFKDFNHLKQIHLNFSHLNYYDYINISKLNMRCFLTSRSRAVIKKFMLSRIIFKKLSLEGYITGVKKAS